MPRSSNHSNNIPIPHHPHHAPSRQPFSPSSSSSFTSPKSLPPNPNINPFSPLSPDVDIYMKSVRPTSPPQLVQPDPSRPFIYYARKALLQIARREQRRGWHTPRTMSPLESWYGAPSHPQMADPAIASIGPPSRAGTGGFGEGFGFGGGIGGKGIARGPRSMGPRRGVDHQGEGHGKDTIQGQMNRFMAKNERKIEEMHKRDNMERKPRRDGDWRRQDSQPQRPYQQRGHLQDEAEPAWMDDNETFGPSDPADAVTTLEDGLVHFIPGKDMIAAHRKDRNFDNHSKPLVSFFGAPEMPSQTAKMPKSFNAADYLLPSRQAQEESTMDRHDPPVESNAFSSRFQRFFGASTTASTGNSPQPPASHSPTIDLAPQHPARAKASPFEEQMFHSPPPTESAQRQSVPPAERVDDHMAKLMGLLSTKSPQPISSPSHPFQASSQEPHSSDRQPAPLDFPHPHLPDPRQAFFPNIEPHRHTSFARGPQFDHHQQQRGQDAQQLLAHAQQRSGPSHHVSLPPHMIHPDMRSSPSGPPFGDMLSPHDLLRNLQYPHEYPSGQGMPLPPPNFMPSGPPPPPGFAPPPQFMGHQSNMPQPIPSTYGRPPNNLNTAQQDMLATLFAGLPRSGGQ